MSERTVYERVECTGEKCDHILGESQYEWCFVKLDDPNPLDEVERLKADIQGLSDGPTVDEWMAMLKEKDAEVARLRGLLRQARGWLHPRHKEAREVRVAIDAALDGECKHDGGWMTEVEHYFPATQDNMYIWRPKTRQLIYDLDVFCRLCGAPTSEVQ